MLSSNHDLMTRGELAAAKIEVAMTKPARQSRLFDSIVSVLYKKRINCGSISVSFDSEIEEPQASQPVLLEEKTETATTTVTENSENSARPFKADVLIAEDNFVNQVVVQQMLDSLGYSTDVAANGSDALLRVQEAEYKLILMDGHMPIMDA